MNHQTPEDWIRQRGSLADSLSDEPIDVRDRVLSTLASYSAVNMVADKTPLVFGGGLLAVAASIMILLLPSLTTMTQPWISFWLL